ncbi:MAG: FAD-dependent oxidoreductase [Solirubrobacteraceae bacterium]|nr:FAD-dependent oxidoreductase [Solirubrobacteraceae bacterium]
MRIAVIGAGVAGLACAAELTAGGAEVTVFEKSRGPGGRTSTRRTEAGAFDHGCPGLVHGAWLLELAPLGLEHAEFAGREVPVPAMSALCRALAAGLDVRAGVRVERISREEGGAGLLGEDGAALGIFERVAVTAPAPQAAELLADAAPDLAARALEVEYAPCWAAMAAWDAPLAIAEDHLADGAPGTPLAWAVRESAKPGRAPGERWTIQAGPGWSLGRLDDEPRAVALDLVAALGVAGHAGPLPAPTFLAAHRWRYARAVAPLAAPCLVDEEAGIGAAGDWCAPRPELGDPGVLQGGAGVPEALHSGRALARALLS